MLVAACSRAHPYRDSALDTVDVAASRDQAWSPCKHSDQDQRVEQRALLIDRKLVYNADRRELVDSDTAGGVNVDNLVLADCCVEAGLVEVLEELQATASASRKTAATAEKRTE
jgi:hypothetical protein